MKEQGMSRKLVTVADVARWDREVDVLVAGLGCAGAAAAIEAARAGADVLVVERASGGGGTSAMSGGVIYLGGGTDLQRACGFEDSAEQMYAYLAASCGDAPDLDKLRPYCEHSVEHYDWFVELGLPFNPVFYPHYSGEPPGDEGLVYSGSENCHPYNEIARPAPRGHVAATANQTGWLLMQKLTEAVEASLATTLYDTRCTALVVDTAGAVVGALLANTDGELAVRVRGGVVLTTGGFICNSSMLEQYAPTAGRCLFKVGAEGDDGSGIGLGMAAGGHAINMEMGSISLPLTPPKSLQRGILVNGQGQRFINEDAYMGALGYSVLYGQQGRAWLILDEACWEKPEVERPISGVGESAEELEQTLGLPTGSLVATLAEYNRGAEQGSDPGFHKGESYLVPLRPPYGALDCTVENSMFAVFTLGGLATDADGRVLAADGAVVEGLYAAGRASACLAAPGYSSGLSIGDGTFFGRRAGRHATGL
ncbi:MAG TPA: FAD-dependent oxidoreductase [Deltaproteobacteria bacterium]|nr:FAD-dependent oxidoreductase [Deltaproteobacteria bacterium]